MATVEDKENLAPITSRDPLHPKSATTPSPKRAARKGRSKSIGPGGLEEEPEKVKLDAKSRRKSTYIPATKSIISSDVEKAERQAARRKTLANRRVSFAPEATLHTWDVVEFMRDPTTSTESSDNTQRTSKGTPRKGATADDTGLLSSPMIGREGATGTLRSPAPASQRRRNSGLPAQSLDESEDESDGSDEESEASESEGGDVEGSDDDTGTAMSLDLHDSTIQSIASEGGSTDSSARLEAALRQAADVAGTRGIEYDEYGDESMEIAAEEITNALQPWSQQRAAFESVGSASMDQENVNPFSPAFKAQLVSGKVNRPSTVPEENTGDLSMDKTRAVGGVMQSQLSNTAHSSPTGEVLMDMTQAIGGVRTTMHSQSPQRRSGQKRRRSTTDAGSPSVAIESNQSKRRRSSVARSSMGDDTMDLTIAVGGVQSAQSPSASERRKIPDRRSFGAESEQCDATMDFTRAVGGVRSANTQSDHTGSSFDENEELTMELTTVLGGIKAANKILHEPHPSTPQNQSPPKDVVNTTPKDHERFKSAPDSGPKKLLTPIFQKQDLQSAEGRSPLRASPTTDGPSAGTSSEERSTPQGLSGSDALSAETIASLGNHKRPLRASPLQSPAQKQISTTPDSALEQQLEAQLQTPEPSPTALKLQRSSPTKIPSTPQQAEDSAQDAKRLAESIKLMSTPRKETLKSVTPKKMAQPSPKVLTTSKSMHTPRIHPKSNTSPARQLSEDISKISATNEPNEKISLQQFLDIAGIRFMDLTASKRRMTTAATPSKAKDAGETESVSEEVETSLESAVVASACTVPELELYEHACHELKRYISDGKRVIKELEAETAQETPPLIQAYMSTGSKRKSVIDAQMRDIKTHARYRSTEMWYAWRSQLLEDLMKGLQGLGEGLIKDDEILQRAEATLESALPELVRQHDALRLEADRLQQEHDAQNEDDKEELEAARQELVGTEAQVVERQKILEELQAQMEQQQSRVNDLEESKEELTAAIHEAGRVREACRGVSMDEIGGYQESIGAIEQTTGWTITSASSSPPTVTMTYKSQMQLFFHPTAFLISGSARPNAPISLTYTADQQPGTTLRFFHQLLRASLQALPQSSTSVSSLLTFVSRGWETALSISEAERRLNTDAITDSRIVSDERLSITSTIFLPKVRSKVRVTLDIIAAIGADGDETELSTSFEPRVQVVYGEPYNETNMTEFMRKEIAGGVDDWSGAMQALKQRLIARGAKGGKRI